MIDVRSQKIWNIPLCVAMAVFPRRPAKEEGRMYKPILVSDGSLPEAPCKGGRKDV
jgi:hypothetical protein